MFWAFEITIFQYFARFWVTNMKPFSGKIRQSIQNYLFQKLVIGRFFEKYFWSYFEAQKPMFWPFEKTIFEFFANLWMTMLKAFSGKVRQSVQNFLNQNLVTGSFLQNALKVSWAQKRTFWAFENTIFKCFATCWATKLKQFSWKVRESSEAKRSKLFK